MFFGYYRVNNNGTKKTQEAKSGSGGGNKYLEKVVDDLVSLNGLFTVAVFMGLSFATPGTIHSLEDRPECDPDVEMRKRIVQFEIASFSCFLFSGDHLIFLNRVRVWLIEISCYNITSLTLSSVVLQDFWQKQ